MKPEQLEKLLVAALRASMAGRATIVPEPGRLIWSWFVEISGTRTYHAAGPNPISHAEIEAWARLHRWPLQPHHVALLRTLDAAWLDCAFAAAKNPKAAKEKPSGALSAGAFDAFFG